MSKPGILIVEDEAIVVADLSIRLAQLGYAVTGNAASAGDAIALARELAPDLVLMDIHLQGPSDGIAAAQTIRQQLNLPVVFVTAYSEGATIERAKEAAPFGYILKPVEDRELKVVIEMALYRHRAEQELREKYAQIECFNKVTVGRELRMIELKKEINALLHAAGQAEKYQIVNDP